MGTREVGRGPTSARAAANLRALREARGLSRAALSERLAKLGRPMLPNGIGKLETGDRRMDVDDLMALAVALGVNPTRLLLPVHYRDDDEPVAITEATSCPAWRAWRWAEGFAPFDDDISSGDWSRYEDFHLHSRPAQMRQAEQHPAARVTAAIRERVLRLVRTPSAEGTRDAVVKGVERDLERLRFELEDLRGGQQAGEGSRG